MVLIHLSPYSMLWQTSCHWPEIGNIGPLDSSDSRTAMVVEKNSFIIGFILRIVYLITFSSIYAFVCLIEISLIWFILFILKQVSIFKAYNKILALKLFIDFFVIMLTCTQLLGNSIVFSLILLPPISHCLDPFFHSYHKIYLFKYTFLPVISLFRSLQSFCSAWSSYSLECYKGL